jgi:hypothetical protein
MGGYLLRRTVASASVFALWIEDEVVIAPVGYCAACCGARRPVIPFSLPRLVSRTAMSTNQSALAVVQEVFRCFGAQDVPGLMALLDEELEWHEPDVDVLWRGVYRGYDGFVS